MVIKKALIFFSGIIVLIILVAIYAQGTSTVTEQVYDGESLQKKDYIHKSNYLSPEVMLEDFHFLHQTIKDVHPDPGRHLEKTWEELVEKTEEQLKEPLTAGNFAIRLSEFITHLEDAHTNVYPVNMERRQLPLSFEWVKEGVIVTESSLNLAERGDLVKEIAGRSVEDILFELEKIIPAENTYWVKHTGRRYLQDELFLDALWLLEGEQLELTVKASDGSEKTVRIPLKEIHDDNGINGLEAGIQEEYFGWSIDEANNTGYYYLNDSKVTALFESSVADFFEALDEAGTENIIIDLRRNGGGSGAVMFPFLSHMPATMYYSYGSETKFSSQASEQAGYAETSGKANSHPLPVRNEQKEPLFNGEVYILTGPGTFSAARDFAVTFHDSGLATIIGEPTGGAPSSFGDTLLFGLPNTGFTLTVSHREFLRPQPANEPEDALYPDILIEREREDFLSEEDKQLERAIRKISSLN
ncbi:S41 family peptidase [Evansella sp. LMS18]|jgi:C-terminal processing protease CtpA/Prc|uniref:S41 family peptidase n=1 Tax=Evansella sp. LMS18 TaxID=2924033 RepID=UPI0020D079A0|nr:S41 family peptidase [Evansella sp. LMS18]UTR10672.1 S41 family peptidase [Evansella sp. LMS18]